MEETLSTTVEAPQEQTTPDVVENQTTETVEETAQPDATQEPENVVDEATENVEAEEPAKEPVRNWEAIAKEHQASFTRVSQELAELKKQMADNKPKIVEDGRINPQFEQQYKFEVDNREFLQYDSLARQLEPEQRAVVENLLREAQRLYNPNNNSAYEQRMAQVKDYFRSDLVEAIAKEKLQNMSQIKARFDNALAVEKQERANEVAKSIEAVPELNELVAPESENFSQDVFDIVKAIFDYTGKLNVESTTKAVQKIKELGVKEYIAKQEAEQAKAKAQVPQSQNVVQEKSTQITAEMAAKNYQKYIDDFVKKGMSFNDAMNKVDEIIMKG